MQTGKILSSAIVSTTATTMFSYLISESKNKNFREPDVIAQLINRLPKTTSKETSQATAWLIHYVIGVAFVTGYNEIWKREKIKPSLTSGALLGAVSGLAGVAGWKVAFELRPNPQPKKLSSFFGHLLLAHVVFGVFSALTYNLLSDNKNT